MEYLRNYPRYIAVEATLWATGLVRKEAWDLTRAANFQALHAARTAVTAGRTTNLGYDRNWHQIDEQQTAQTDLLRHIVGNPFRPYTSPAHWPTPVIQLADALYHGEPCSFALHDALLEAGHPVLADHFRDAEHPKGCWALDSLLGKK